MCCICDDNRLEIIEKTKNDLMENTNIKTSHTFNTDSPTILY